MRSGRGRQRWIVLLAAAGVVFAAGALAAQETLILNEVELNPEGLDSGNEWIEILNLSDEVVDLAGWSVSYTYRGPGTLPITDGSRLLAPGERIIYVYPGLALRNADATVIRLIDPAGLVVDETSPLEDTADDETTWQRFPDGGDPWFPDLWLFLPATRGRTND